MSYDVTDLLCPLPLLRVTHSEDDVRSTFIEPCGQPLGVITTMYQYATVSGLIDGANPHWEVKCLVGHVVFTYDDEGNDYDIPFDPTDLTRALAYMSHEHCLRVSPTAALMDSTP